MKILSDRGKSMSEEIKRRKPNYLWFYTIVGFVFLLIIGVISYVHGFSNNVRETFNVQMYEPLRSIDQQRSKEKVIDKDTLNILLLGVEQRAGMKGNLDSMIVLSLNPKTQTTKLISVPKETRALIVGKDLEGKINHAYTYGEANMVVDSLERLLDIELDFYVQMNLNGAADLIDSLGGITVNNELDFKVDEVHFAPGEVHLSGAQALRYVQVNYDDPTGDVGLTARQQQVIEAIAEKGSREITLNKVELLLDFIGDNLKTNLDFQVIRDLAINYSGVQNSVTSYMLQGNVENMDGIYYLTVPEEEIMKVNQWINGDEEAF